MSEGGPANPSVRDPAPDNPRSVDPNSIEGLFVDSLAKTTAEERRAFLDRACVGDVDRRRRVEALLRAYEDAGSFLERPAGDWQNPTLGAAGPADPQRLDFLAPSDKPGCLGTLGPYEVLEVIGRGGMGIVMRALDLKLNRIVAIKAMTPEQAANPNARRRFLREAQAAAAVSHPHVITIHAVEDDKIPYLVMECVVGQSLQQKLEKTGSLPLTEILRIGTQIAEGLAAAHNRGLIHRDIKPANILLENGVERVKITDFGLARTVDDVAITVTGEVSGTPQYMSPEQARGEKVDKLSDLFSLGCVLYAMCTGRSPFRAENLAGAIRRVCDGTPHPIADVNPEIPAWLIEIVDRLLAKRPEDRFQQAEDVATALSRRLAFAQPAPAPDRQPAAKGDAVATAERRTSVVVRVSVFLAITLFSFALARLSAIQDQFVTAIAVIAVLLAIGYLPIHWLWNGWREAWRPVLGLFVGVAALFIGGMAGAPDGGRLFSSVPNEILCTAAGSIGIAFLTLAVLMRRRRAVVAPAPSRVSAQPAPANQSPARSALAALMTVLLVAMILPAAVFAILMLRYLISEQRPSPAVVVIEYDPSTPVAEIQVTKGPKYIVDSNPYRLAMPPGQHLLTVTFDAGGQRHALEKVVRVDRGGGAAMNVDLRPDIALRLQQLGQLPTKQEAKKQGSSR